jgi:transposase
MPRFKPVHKGLKLLPVDFEKQVQPGSFEHALCYLIDYELDLSEFHARYNNDDEGAPAYDPAVLLKIILLAYSRGIGIVASRRIEAACRENVLFIAVSGDSQPNFTTLAAFVSESVHAARTTKGGWAVEALLPHAQHREAGPSWVCELRAQAGK